MIQTLLNYIYRYFFFIRNRNVILNGKLKIKNRPIVNILNGSSLIIGENVTLNSKNSKYHINMFGPIKIYLDKSKAKIKIGDNTRIHGSCLHAYESIEIGNNCLISSNCQIFDGSGHDTLIEDPAKRINSTGGSKPITIGDNCWIGAKATFLDGSSIGDGCVVAAGAVVTKSFPKNSVIVGVPAKVMKKRV